MMIPHKTDVLQFFPFPMRKLVNSVLFLTISSLSAFQLGAEVLTITNLPDVRPGENNRTNFAFAEVRSLDLNDFFQVYPSPGPRLTIEFTSPVLDSVREVDLAVAGDPSANPVKNPESPNIQSIWTYQTVDGQPYDHILDAHPDRFVWQDHEVVFDLHAADSPMTVANFLSYVKRGDFDRTIIHRRVAQTGLNVLQAGGFHFKDYAFPQGIVRRANIPTEPNLENVAGTLAMANTGQPDSATNQFFINLTDSSLPREAYASFGELVSGNLDVLVDLGRAIVGRLPNSNPAWTDIPFYTPLYYLSEAERSFVSLDRFTATEGTTDGISLSWEFYAVEEDEDDEDSPEPVEPDRDSFEISIDDDGIFSVRRRDTGFATVIVKATYQGQEREFFWNLAAYNPEVGRHADPSIEAFPGNLYVHNVMGTFFDIHAPYFFHESLGNIWLSRLRPDGVNLIGTNQIYVKDNLLGWLYGSNAATLSASRPAWPWFYSFENEAWIFHVVESTPDNRFFWDPRREEWFSTRVDSSSEKGWVVFRWDSESESWEADEDFFVND